MRRLRLKFSYSGDGAERVGYVIMSFGVLVLAGVLYEFNLAINEVAYWDTRMVSVERRVQRATAPQGSPSSPSSRSSPSYVSSDTKQEVKKSQRGNERA